MMCGWGEPALDLDLRSILSRAGGTLAPVFPPASASSNG